MSTTWPKASPTEIFSIHEFLDLTRDHRSDTASAGAPVRSASVENESDTFRPWSSAMSMLKVSRTQLKPWAATHFASVSIG